MSESVKIADFLHRVKVPVHIDPDTEYALVTVKLHHKGVVLREMKKGKLLGSNMYRISKGQFILSGIDARNGAFGIVPEELDGAIITNDFWCFDVDEAIVKRDFFYWLSSTPLFLHACRQSSRGVTQRIRLQKDLFYTFELNFPSLEEQDEFLQNIQTVDQAGQILERELDFQTTSLSLLRQAILQEAIEGKLTADWRTSHPVRKGDPNTDAEALLAQIKAEKQKWIAEGKIRKEKPLSPIKPEEVPFVLPEGWVWCRLGEVVSYQNGYAFKSEWFREDGFRLVRNINVSHDVVTWDNQAFLSPDKAREFQEFNLSINDIVISLDRPIISTGLKVAKIREQDLPCLLLQRVLKLSPICFMNEYLFRWIKSIFFISGINPGRSIGIPHVSHKEIMGIPFPLPPIAEQNEIVRLADRHLGDVDELVTQVTERKGQTEELMQAVLREAFEGEV